MNKILKVSNDTITVGLQDGSIATYYIEDCNFFPVVGDIVTIYQSNGETIITKSENDFFQEEHIDYGNDRPSVVLNFFSFFAPIIGIIAYFILISSSPMKAKGAIKWAFVGVLVSIAISVVTSMFVYTSVIPDTFELAKIVL